MQRQHLSRILLAVSLLAVTVLFVGCGGRKVLKTDVVTGKVTLDGVPVEGVQVNFTPVKSGEGTPSIGVTQADGTYKLQALLGRADAGTTPGEYVVTLSKTKEVPTGKKLTNSTDGSEYEETKPEETLPAIYTNHTKTPYKRTVKAGVENVFDFDMKK